MYPALLSIHSIVRWLVLLSLVYAIYRAARGYFSHRPFARADNAARHWTATFAHIQLLVGMLLYTQSPVVKYFWNNTKAALQQRDITFFGALHLPLMMTAIVLLTIGSAMAKRKKEDREKFRTMLLWFTLALSLILVAIPWPFSPLAGRPYIR
ncbi:hypothetical protein [Chitinophaga sp. YIM B06452]|uniref:hypothetical protein n=1 Tax=Chitinophaga sp. YIM B06452 TaxID=3082158 RepID=UPI0031FEFA7F